MTEWIDEAAQILESKSETRILRLCKGFEDCEKQVQELFKDIEKSVEPEFSVDYPILTLKEPEDAKKLGDLGERKYLFYLAMSVNIYIAKNEGVKSKEGYIRFKDAAKKEVKELSKHIGDKRLVPTGSKAYQNSENGFINLQMLPKSQIPDSKLFKPLREHVGYSKSQVKGTLAHELTHAYIKEETGVTTASINIDTSQGLFTAAAMDDGEIESKKSRSMDPQLVAINEAAGHVSGRIYDDQSFNVRGYETDEGIKRKDAHQSVYLLTQLSDSYKKPGEKLSRIREVAAAAIKKKHEKNQMFEGFKIIQKTVSQRINRIPDPDSAVGYLELLVLERTEKIEMEKYEKLGYAAEKFMESEVKILNFFSIINDSSREYESHDFNNLWERLVPVEDKEVSINLEKLGVPKRGENLRYISPEEFEKALEEVNKLPNTSELQKYLKRFEKLQRNEETLFQKVEDEFLEEEKDLDSNTELITKEIFDPRVTDHHEIRKAEIDMQTYLDKHISRRKKLISEAEKLCREIIQVEKEIEKLEKNIRSTKNSEEVSKLIELAKRNVRFAEKSLEKLKQSKRLLNQAQETIKN